MEIGGTTMDAYVSSRGNMFFAYQPAETPDRLILHLQEHPPLPSAGHSLTADDYSPLMQSPALTSDSVDQFQAALVSRFASSGRCLCALAHSLLAWSQQTLVPLQVPFVDVERKGLSVQRLAAPSVSVLRWPS